MGMDELKELQKERDKIQSRIMEIEREQADAKNAAMVGCCFVYMNSYGGGRERWPLYTKVTGAKDGGLRAFRFQRKEGNDYEIETESFRISTGSLGDEISEAHFNAAWLQMRDELDGLFHTPQDKETGR